MPPAGQSPSKPHAVAGALEHIPGSGVGVAVGIGELTLKNCEVTFEGNEDKDAKKVVGPFAALPPGKVL